MIERLGSARIAALCGWVAATACNRESVLAGETSCIAFAPEVFGEFGAMDNRPPASPWARIGDLVVGAAGTQLLLFDVSTRTEPVRLSQLELNGEARQVEFVSADTDQVLVALSKRPVLDAGELPTPETRRPVDTLLRVDVSDPVSPRVVSEQGLSGRLWQFRQTTAALWVLEGIPKHSRCDFDDSVPDYPTFELSSFRVDTSDFVEIDRVELRGKTLGWLHDNAAFASTQLYPYGSPEGRLSYARFGADGTVAERGEVAIDGTIMALSMAPTEVRAVVTAERSLVLQRTAVTPPRTSSTTTVGTAEFNGRLRASFVGDWLFVSSTEGNSAARTFRLTEDAAEEVDAPSQAREVRPLQGLHPQGAVEPARYALARGGSQLSVLEVTDADISVLDDFVVPGISAAAAFGETLGDGPYLVAVGRSSGIADYHAFEVSTDRIEGAGSTSAPIGQHHALGDVLVGGGELRRTWLHAWEADKTSAIVAAAPFELSVAAARVATVRFEGNPSTPVLAIADHGNPNEPLWEAEVPEHHELVGVGDFFVGVGYESPQPRARVFSATGKPRLVSDLEVPEDQLGRPSKDTGWHGERPAALLDDSVVFEAQRNSGSESFVAHYSLQLSGHATPTFGEAVWGSAAVQGNRRWELMPFGDRLIAARVEHFERVGDGCSDRVFVELIGEDSDGALHSSEPFAVRGRPVAMTTPPMDRDSPVLLSVEPVSRNTDRAQLHRTRLGPVGSALLDTLVLEGRYEDVRVVGNYAVVLSRSEGSCDEALTLTAIHVAGPFREMSTLELPADRWAIVGSDEGSVLLQAGSAPRTFAKINVADDGTLGHASTRTAHCSQLPLEDDDRDVFFADSTLTCLTGNGVERVRF